MTRVEERVVELERQVAMLERMIQLLGDTLDRRFERYENVIETQGQRIAELSLVLLSLLSGQHKQSAALRERVAQLAPSSDVGGYYDLLDHSNESSGPPSAAAAQPAAAGAGAGAGAGSAGAAAGGTPDFPLLLHGHQHQHQRQQPQPQPQPRLAARFEFLKSPHSVEEVWREYVDGINGQPSIKEMENMYQTGWRRDPAVNKRYARRKVLWRAIENGLARGYELEYIIKLLEEYRYIDREKGIKHPIGWICQNQNIPEELR